MTTAIYGLIDLSIYTYCIDLSYHIKLIDSDWLSESIHIKLHCLSSDCNTQLKFILSRRSAHSDLWGQYFWKKNIWFTLRRLVKFTFQHTPLLLHIFAPDARKSNRTFDTLRIVWFTGKIYSYIPNVRFPMKKSSNNENKEYFPLK